MPPVNNLRKHAGHRPGIMRVLLLALLIHILLPLQFHAHHEVETGAHPGTHHGDVHAHAPVEPAALDHVATEYAHDVPVAGDAITKQPGMKPVLAFAALFFVLLCLPPVLRAPTRLRAETGDRSCRSSHYILSPPLRAPPHS